MIRFETRTEKLASSATFHRRLVRSGTVGFIMVAVSLGIGMAGYGFFEHLGAIDAFLNASMILSGMGPLHDPESIGGKLFAGIYALYSGFAVLVIAAVTFAPVIHRIMHRFHVETGDDAEKAEEGGKARPKDKARASRRR
ncbi:MAG TPA: hypothetical protein VH301_00695 [Usitatibacter sp.]|jgi:hypothetical protein|nr:hypothetical protein [Usitatibacter sp.]